LPEKPNDIRVDKPYSLSPDNEVHEGARRLVEVADKDPLLEGPDVEVQDVEPLVVIAYISSSHMYTVLSVDMSYYYSL
jgi:hypothetical protein